MLSFTKGTPIAKIDGGEYDGMVVHIYDPDEDNSEGEYIIEDDMMNDLCQGIMDKLGRRILKVTEVDKIKEIINNNALSGNKLLDDVAKRVAKLYSEKVGKELYLNAGTMIPLLKPDSESDHFFVGAPTGAGKSTVIAIIVDEHLKGSGKGKKVFLFSRKESDKALDKLNPIRIMINEELLDDPIDMEELKDSICIFDDIDTIQDEVLLKYVRKLRDDLLQCGRDPYNIKCFCTTHLLMNGSKTKSMIYEAPNIVVFPRVAGEHVKNLLVKYGGLDKPQAKKISDLGSRWVMLYKNYPQYVIHQNGCYSLMK